MAINIGFNSFGRHNASEEWKAAELVMNNPEAFHLNHSIGGAKRKKRILLPEMEGRHMNMNKNVERIIF